jgi:hypothetical protein
MAYPQGTFQYTGGIGNAGAPLLGGWEVTQTHGMTPNSFHVTIPMTPGAPPDKNGDVIVQYGDDPPITIKDCTIDKIDQDIDGALEWNVTILDRRYLWRFGQISGAYNVRWKNGTDVREETKKKPSELAKLCLAKMWAKPDGTVEADFDVSALVAFDDTDWPEINWNVDNPAQALCALCERYELRPVMDWKNNRVVVVIVGEGEELNLEIPTRKTAKRSTRRRSRVRSC